MAVHEALGEAFGSLDRSGIGWCVLRGDADLADPRDDVDVLVDAADARRFAACLRSLGFMDAPVRGYGTHTLFTTYHLPTERCLEIDVVTELGFGPHRRLVLPVADGCLARRTWRSGVPVLCADDRFWTLLTHCVLDLGRFPEAHARAARELAPHADPAGPLAVVLAPTLPAGVSPEALRAAVGAADWEALGAMRAPWCESWRRRQSPVNHLRALRAAGRSRAARLATILQRRPPVAVMGRGAAAPSSVAAGDVAVPLDARDSSAR